MEATSRYWHDVTAWESALKNDPQRGALHTHDHSAETTRGRRRVVSQDHWWWQNPDRIRIESFVTVAERLVPVHTIVIGNGNRWWTHHGSEIPMTNNPTWASPGGVAHLVRKPRNVVAEEMASWVLLGRQVLFTWVTWQEGATVWHLDRLCRIYTACPRRQDFERMPLLHPWFPGGERYTLIVDQQSGLILKVSTWFQECNASVWEVTRIDFDQTLPLTLFEPPEPTS